jgi:hypothetical protein
MLQESIATKNFITIKDQFYALNSKNTQLGTALKEEDRPQSDDITIQQMKRGKLALEDLISKLSDG